MNNARTVLKSAFIDAQIIECNKQVHAFSKKFEDKMQILIQHQRGLFKLINTTKRKIACIILSILVIATSTVFSVEALREPVVEAIQEFFVNVKEQLTGTKANNIAAHFTDDITEIVATNYITSSPKEYIINDAKIVSDFTQLLSNTEWKNPRTKYDAGVEYVFWKFEFNNANKTITTVNMCGWVVGRFGIVEIIYDGNSYVYNVSEQTYLDILAFTTRKYFLHQTDMALPKKELCLDFQNQALSGLTDDEKELVSRNLREAHTMMEILLLENVSILKEPDSPYWYPSITGEEFTDPFSGEVYINGDACFNGVIRQLENACNTIKDVKTKKSFEIICEDLKSACDNRDIGSLFTVHESIHDFDYFGINYPAHFELLAPPDWNGVNVYFGHLE